MKKPSKNPMKLACSLSLFVTRPMEVKTEIFISAKETPTTRNNTLKNQKAFAKGITKHMQPTNNKAANIDFLMPNLGKNEAMRKETIAMGKSLNPSKTLA